MTQPRPHPPATPPILAAASRPQTAGNTSVNTAAANLPTHKHLGATKTPTKKRQQLKRAQIQATQNAAVSYFRNPMISAFAPPHHLLSHGGPVLFQSPEVASPSWVYVPRSASPAIHVSHGCVFPSSSGRGSGALAYTGGVGDSVLKSSGPQQSRAQSSRVDVPSLGRFSSGDGGSNFDDAFGLDLHLSLAPAAP